MSREHLTRKDVAQITELSVDSVRRNEKRWGLEKIAANNRVIRYKKQQAITVLKKIGFVQQSTSSASA